MLKKSLILAAALLMQVFTAAAGSNAQEARLALETYSEGHPQVLEQYDRAVSSWEAYAAGREDRWDLDLLLKAVAFAAEKHAGQTRKDAGKTPYIIHPIGVARLLWEVGQICSVNVLAAALLHDTLEDTAATEDEIEALFGQRVLYTVKEVTNDPRLTGEQNKVRQVKHAPEMSLDGQLVKLADRLYNVSDLDNPPPDWSKEKVDGYYLWGEKLLNALTGANAGLENALQERIDAHGSIRD